MAYWWLSKVHEFSKKEYEMRIMKDIAYNIQRMIKILLLELHEIKCENINLKSLSSTTKLIYIKDISPFTLNSLFYSYHKCLFIEPKIKKL